MDFKQFFKDKNYLIALTIAVIGILLMWKGGDLLRNIGSVMLVSGCYTILDSMFLKQALLDLIIQKVQLDKDIDNTGLMTIDATLTNINYKNYIENMHKEMDIIHNYL